MKNHLCVLLVAVAAAAAVFAQSVPRAAVPVEPVGAILDAFRTHALVALADEHGSEQGSAFRLTLHHRQSVAGFLCQGIALQPSRWDNESGLGMLQLRLGDD